MPVTTTVSLQPTVMVITSPTPYVPLGVVEVTAVTVGAVVSIAIDVVPAIEPAEPGAGRVRLAALGLFTVSKIVPPLRVRELVLV